ncbi:LamG domain-containing protein [Adhaeribacter radiodurans]|uniref:LamG domain-containing protein n=1 Tax=Adhaeribacter radiodurans TaxID=2745197 RepID=A0A7L7LFD6_9BACT|nr:LamG domain-containing protein [Adhaeribacter radiodurans]QMU31550.1 LamG domain-containing protein [Adhaeribacter radiodurans]
MPNSNLLNSNAFTVCFWYKADLTDSLRQAILSKSDTSRYGYSIDLKNSEYYSNVGFAYKDKKTQFESWSLFGPRYREWVPGAERKYEFAVVAFSEKAFVDYLGGRAVEYSPSTFFNSNVFDLYIGKSENGRYKNFKGEIDDLLIYNRILTKEEVEKLYRWKKGQ